MSQTPTSYLVDTHAFLWFIFDDSRLSNEANRALSDVNAVPILSLVSLWEIAIKVPLGKLELGMSYEVFLDQFVESRSIDLLDLQIAHLKHLPQLPFLHRDPFDRLLISQAITEGLPILTADKQFAHYPVEVFW